jgi:diacylglycerol kinase (ATP)
VRVTLIHNPTAGDDDHSGEALRSLLAEAGHDVAYQSTKAADWQAALTQPSELVVAAGGDGTVRKVFKEPGLGAAVTVLPLGSANNIARTLGFADEDVRRVVDDWSDGRRRPFDIGLLSAPWGEARFVESFGGGVFADLLARAEEVDSDADGEEKVELGLRLLAEVLEEAPSEPWSVEVDGAELSEHLLGVEVMNVREIGPNVALAPDADPTDGLFDVVCIRSADRSSLSAYVAERIQGNRPDAPRLPALRGRSITVRPPGGCRLHVDDGLWPEEPGARVPESSITIGRRSVELLLPSGGSGA